MRRESVARSKSLHRQATDHQHDPSPPNHGLYIRTYEDWDQLAEAAKTWIELCRSIQEAFQHQLNVTAPTAGHQGYAPALPFQHNAFGALAGNKSDDDSTKAVVTQMAALTYQSQLTATTTANLSQQMGQYMQTLAHQQDLLHQNQHQMMERWQLCRSIKAMRDAATDAQDADSLHQRPHFPPRYLDAPTTVDALVKDEDVNKDVAEAHPVSLPDVDPPSCQSRQLGHQGVHGTSGCRRRILCSTTPGTTYPAPSVLEPHEEVCELECVLFLWF
jgi:hypothetical protein